MTGRCAPGLYTPAAPPALPYAPAFRTLFHMDTPTRDQDDVRESRLWGGDEGRLPGWALRAGDRYGRGIASTMLGGAMFAFIGLLLQKHVEGPVGQIGEALAWAGGGAWLFGCCWFVQRCKARPGWLAMLLRANITGVAAVWALMYLSSEMMPKLLQQYAVSIAAQLPEGLDDPSELFGTVFKFLIAAIFAWQAKSLTEFCKAAAEPDRDAGSPDGRPRKRWNIPPPDAPDGNPSPTQ